MCCREQNSVCCEIKTTKRETELWLLLGMNIYCNQSFNFVDMNEQRRRNKREVKEIAAEEEADERAQKSVVAEHVFFFFFFLYFII